MRRESYYIISCSSEENQKGVFHYSLRFATLKEAIKEAEKINADFLSIEKHIEEWDRYEWRLVDSDERIKMVWYQGELLDN